MSATNSPTIGSRTNRWRIGSTHATYRYCEIKKVPEFADGQSSSTLCATFMSSTVNVYLVEDKTYWLERVLQSITISL